MMLKTIVVLGAAYGGNRGTCLLAHGVPKGWRVVVIDRNTHANHTYILPRLAVLPGHEYKAFIPLDRMFQLPEGTEHPHLILHAHVEAITPNSVTLSRAFPEHGIHTTTLEYDYALYALGSRMPEPLNLWGSVTYTGTKVEAMDWLKANQKVVQNAGSILVVGGGALGIQFATDIKSVHHEKSVTLLHSRRRLLPKFDEEMHFEIMKELESIDIDTILGERLDLESAKADPPMRNEKGQTVVKTLNGREIAADLIMLCTGQQPHTQMLKDMDPATVNPDDNLARVLPTLQLCTQRRKSDDVEEIVKLQKALDGVFLSNRELSSSTLYPNIFVTGDCADAFGAIQAGHTAYYQSETAANNILKLIRGKGELLEAYKHGLPAIKVSLGLKKSVYQVNGEIGTKNDGVDDLQAAVVWPSWGVKVEKDEDMYD